MVTIKREIEVTISNRVTILIATSSEVTTCAPENGDKTKVNK